MPIEFKSKGNSNRLQDVEVDSLVNFILKNKLFLGLTLSVLGDNKKQLNNLMVESAIKNNSRYNQSIETSSLKNKFIDLMKKFYNVDDDMLNKRRGRMLEILWNTCSPYTPMSKHVKVEEAQVFHDGVKLSDKDIDIAFKENFIELHECKASAKNTLRIPLRDAHKEKLELMKKTKQISTDENMKCELFLVTFDYSPSCIERLLKKSNFNSFNIICRGELESRL